MNFDLSLIYVRPDGSYVVNQGMYHIPNEGKWADLWAQVDAYAKEHPEVVQEEPIHTLSQSELIQKRIDELQTYLNETDWYVIRYVDTGVPIPVDVRADRQEARAEIEALREQLAGLTPAED